MADTGPGENLLLLPGMMCDHRLWRHQAELLGGAREVSFGSIGMAADISQIAQQVLRQAPDKFSLAGLSMGGIVAFEMWRQAPQRIERLALLDTNFKPDMPHRQALRDDQIKRVEAGQLLQVMRDELKPNYLAEIHKGNSLLLDDVLQMGMDLGADVFVRQSRALRDRPDSAGTLDTIDCPTLVLCGCEDELCPPSLHEEMASRIKNAALHTIDKCGHLSTLEQPEAVTAALQEWLEAA